MLKQKTAKPVSVFILLVLLAFVLFRILHGGAPRKPNPIPPGDYSYTVAYAEHRIRQTMERHHLPSVAVALIDDQNVIWQEAFGLANVEEGLPATTNTIYKLLSVAKVFTALETMRLVEEGRIDLDAPVADYLPGFTIQSRFRESEPITVRSILAHRSGLPRNPCWRVELEPGSRSVPEELVASLADGYQAFPIGDRYKYSNMGLVMLGTIIQQIRGKPFASHMKESLLASAGMECSAFVTADLPRGKGFASGYEYWKGDYYPRGQGDIATLPSGNLYSTVADMADFVRFILRDGEGVIEAETLKAMFEDQFTNRRDPQPMGLGWKLSPVFGGEKLVWHDGGPTEGIGALVALLPERKLGVVLFANEVSFDGSIAVPLALEILEPMLETKDGVVPPESNARKAVDVDRAQLEAYAGRYVAWGKIMEVSQKGGRLKGEIQGMGFDLVPTGQSRFKVDHWLMKLGLDHFFNLPVDLRKLEIEFSTEEEMMTINIANISHEACPRYPVVTEIPDLWKRVAGKYDLSYRFPSDAVGSEVVGRSEIQIEDGVLSMGGFVGPLKPISETEMVILSGPFAGETMVYEPETACIYHQSIVFKPTKPDPATGSP